MKRKTSSFTRGAAAGLLLSVLFFGGLCIYQEWSDHHPFQSRRMLSGEQIRKVAEALAAYEESNKRRPANLEALVKAGLLSPADLFDRRRSTVPAIDEATGRFASNPDVLYFPALRRTDPAEMVLLCTITTRKRGGRLLAVFNDYRTAELTPRELCTALQRTYSNLGREVSTYHPAHPVQ